MRRFTDASLLNLANRHVEAAHCIRSHMERTGESED